METIKIKELIINKFYSEKEKIYGQSNLLYNSSSHGNNLSSQNSITSMSGGYFSNQNQIFKSPNEFTPKKHLTHKNIHHVHHETIDNDISIEDSFSYAESQRLNTDPKMDNRPTSGILHTRSDSFMAMLKNIIYKEKK